MEQSLSCPIHFVTAIIPDGQGGIWVSGEDGGICHGTIKNQPHHQNGGLPNISSHLANGSPLHIEAHWTRYDKSNSPGLASDFITALCIDGQGRLWAGTNRHGLCVFNGKKWKHYGILTGPLGDHICAISYDRYARQVWIATENGMSIYQCSRSEYGIVPNAQKHAPPRYAPGTWHDIPIAQNSGLSSQVPHIVGLPPAPDCIAFDSAGTAFVGTQWSGLAIGMAKAVTRVSLRHFSSTAAYHTIQYTWHIVAAPWHLPATPYGNGLPSNLLNAILVAPHGHVLVATDLGLALSTNDGKSFHYVRGKDYAAKVMGQYPSVSGWIHPSKSLLKKLLPDDEITSLAYDLAGHIWVGTWRSGFRIMNSKADASLNFKNNHSNWQVPKDYITALCPLSLDSQRNRYRHGKISRQIILIGSEGFGVNVFSKAVQVSDNSLPAGNDSTNVRTISGKVPRFPVIAPPPSANSLRRLRVKVRHLDSARMTHRFSSVLADDWRTQGNWIDRYGTFADVCATMNGDGCDQAGGYHNQLFCYRSWVGPGSGPKNYLRYWVEWNQTDQTRVLQDLNRGGRKESEWDDHGEALSVNRSGLGVFCTIHLPAGVYEISTYCLNKDAHTNYNRYAMCDRDYVVSLCDTPMADRLFLALGRIPQAARLVWRFIKRQRNVARARVCHFWGGVYTRFVIRRNRPGYVTLAIHRNHSFNTITCGVFVNRVDKKGLISRVDVRQLRDVNGIPQNTIGLNKSKHAATASAAVLINRLLKFRTHHPLAYMQTAPEFVVPLLRYYFQKSRNTQASVSRIWGLRRALSRMARDVGQFKYAQRIMPPERLIESYCWRNRTRNMGDKGKPWQWNQAGYDQYLKKMRKDNIALR